MTSDLQALPILFLLTFPGSVLLWSVVVVDGGFVRNVSAMPWEVRLAARVAGAGKRKGSSGPIWGSLLCLGLINFPVLVILVHPYGPVAFAAAVGYAAVHLCWLARIRRAVRRADREKP